MWLNIKNFVLEIILPITCVFCAREGESICLDCRSTFDLAGKYEQFNSTRLNRLYSALSYQEKRVSKLIQMFKYKPYVRVLASSLALIISDYFQMLEQKPGQDFVLVPVPTSKKKLRLRGYNPAAEISCELAKIWGLTVVDNALIKARKTLAQTELSETERRENVKGAFRVGDSAPIKNKPVFLVDDVFTTGATMEECARILKKAGAKQVWGIAIARG